MNVDFHIHSTNSDGSDTPEELFIRGKKLGLKHISITDHDTIIGIEENKILASKYNINYTPGIEISAYDYKNSRKCHIVGLNVNSKSKKLNSLIDKTSKLRHNTSILQIKKLIELGYNISLEKILEERKNKVVFKQHIMKALIEKNYAKKIYGDFYYKMFKNKGPLDIKIPYPDHNLAIKILKESGSIPILAHPTQYDNLVDIDNMVSDGLAGIEWNYPSVTEQGKKEILDAAEKYNLILSTGSDYHGDLE
jgi:predicted metal-dependent phosphoesterase TrpH